MNSPWLLISVFCLGACVGMIYTFAVYRIVTERHKKKNGKNVDNTFYSHLKN